MWSAEKVSLNSLSFPISFTLSKFSQNNMYSILLLSHPTEQIISCQGALSNLCMCEEEFKIVRTWGECDSRKSCCLTSSSHGKLIDFPSDICVILIVWHGNSYSNNERTTHAPRAIKVSTIYIHTTYVSEGTVCQAMRRLLNIDLMLSLWYNLHNLCAQ